MAGSRTTVNSGADDGQDDRQCHGRNNEQDRHYSGRMMRKTTGRMTGRTMAQVIGSAMGRKTGTAMGQMMNRTTGRMHKGRKAGLVLTGHPDTFLMTSTCCTSSMKAQHVPLPRVSYM